LVLAYQDVLFALQSEKGVNNGSPSLHARLLAELDVQIGGDRIVHVGAGTGYYSAILAELVGTSGHVHAVEMDPDLAAHAQAALADRANLASLTPTAVNGHSTRWMRSM
jgi:protein-L-isoaspartate(D-aspartate) O-methyltransferase